MTAKFVTQADSNRGFEFQVFDDAGEKIDWFITVCGVDSDAYREKQNEQRRRNIVDINRTKSMVQTMSRAESDAVELIAAATTGWRGADAIVPYSPAEALRVYTEFPQVRMQADQNINERANFLPKAATSS